MKKQILILFIAIIGFQALSAQDDEIIHEDKVYVDYIKSVVFHIEGIETSYPVIQLNSSSQLLFRFDDMGGGFYDYTYEIVHCDRNWNPSTDITEFDFLEGFNGELIRDYSNASLTTVNYTKYQLSLPNENIKWTISGNYVLIIKDDQELPIITRRFMVVDPEIKIEAYATKPARVEYLDTGQALDFKITTKDFPISDPMTEIKVSFMQNGRWDNAYTNVSPTYTAGDEIFFRDPNRYFFPAQKEFRSLDMRNFEYTTVEVHSIDRHPDRTDVILEIDKDRANRNYLTTPDANGSFVIQNLMGRFTQQLDDSEFVDPVTGEQLEGSLLARARLLESLNSSGRERDSDYAHVQFTLNIDKLDKDVYIVGKFNDWRPTKEYKLEYSEKYNSYLCNVLLKQGYYDYYYAVIDDEGKIDTELLEGNWHETENDYLAIVYYRPFGENYDQIIGFITLNTSVESSYKRN